MASAETRLDLTRLQVVAFRRHAGALDERLSPGPQSLQRAAWAGLQDSMPRAAVLSIHARVAGTEPASWEDPSLVQLWGPRYSVFVVAARDLAVFSLGTMPDDLKGRQRAQELAAGLAAALGDERIPYGEAGGRLGVHPNRLRYAAATGTVLIRWEGARQPTVWIGPARTWTRARRGSNSPAATCTPTGRPRPRRSARGRGSAGGPPSPRSRPCASR